MKRLDARHFKIDFRKAPSERWEELLTDPWAIRKARTLCNAVSRQWQAQFGRLTPLVTGPVAKAASFLARRSQGDLDYVEDMEVWSEYAVGDFNRVILANFSYEVSQVHGGIGNGLQQAKNGIFKRLGFCTSVAFRRPRLGMVHCRNMDWPISQIKDATIVLDCKSDAGPFKAVSVPGMVGVLSGVARGRFSMTVNSKEDLNHVVPNPAGWGATLLVRWIFECCGSYEAALRELRKAPAFVPFYVMLVGLKPDEAVVVEVNRSGRNRVHKQPGYPVAVANHYPAEISEDEEMDSQERQELVEERAIGCKAKSLSGCFSVVNEYPVMHAGTVQSMVLHPRTGTVLLQHL